MPAARTLDPDEALAELTRRYFSSHGPATVRDFVWWSGLTVRQARIGIELAGQALVQQGIGDRICWLAPSASAAPPASPSAHLLPIYDEFLTVDWERMIRMFGRENLTEWPLEAGITYLNHGTVGVTPRRVLAAQQAIRDDIERHPSRFLLRELTNIVVGQLRAEKPRLREAADAVAGFLGARGDDLVFVDNATTGANAVLRSFPLQAGDEILVTDLGYGGVLQAAAFAARERGASVRSVTMPYPVRSAGDLLDACVTAIRPTTRLAIVDHIAAESALVFPLAEIAAQCRARGVAVLADGAHAPGAIALDLPSLGVDWYVGNLHKWMWTPRSSGILWASPERQRGLHPVVISWGLDQGFTTEFDSPGTRDPSPHLAAPHAIAFMRELGVESVQAYNHALAWDGARRLAERWDSGFDTPESLIGVMATVALPEALGATRADAARVRDRLLFEDRIEVAMQASHGRLHARISAQIYNDLTDIDRLAEAVLRMAGGG